MILASLLSSGIPSYNPIPSSGLLGLIFYKTDLTVQVLGFPQGGYSINLIELIVLAIIAIAVNAITERLTSSKVGGLFVAIILTILGAYLCETFVKLGFDFSFEGVRIIASLIGAIVVAVFYTLIRAQFSKGGKK